MPAQQGVEIWPGRAPNLAALTGEDSLPFRNAMFDRILLVHALEESPDPLAMLREVWRVMAPSGRVVVVVAARNGPWANSEVHALRPWPPLQPSSAGGPAEGCRTGAVRLDPRPLCAAH